MPLLERETGVFPENLFREALGPSDRRWWAVYTRSGQEKALARDLLGFRIPFFLPLATQPSCIPGRQIASHDPIFDGYLFIYGRDEDRFRTLTTQRVSRILPVTNQEQLRIDLQQVNQIIEAGAALSVERRIEAGRRVRIRSGPMTGLEGIVTTRRGHRRLVVSVEFLQNGVSVEIDDYLAEPLD